MLIYRFPLERILLIPFANTNTGTRKRGTRVLNLMKFNIGNYLRAANKDLRVILARHTL